MKKQMNTQRDQMFAVYNDGIRPEKPTPRYLVSLLNHRIKTGYVLKNIQIIEKPDSYLSITASLYVFGIACSASYMDDKVQDYCSRLAVFLRDETDYNQFFDLAHGKLTLFC
jgi:hypothetical protein